MNHGIDENLMWTNMFKDNIFQVKIWVYKEKSITSLKAALILE